MSNPSRLLVTGLPWLLCGCFGCSDSGSDAINSDTANLNPLGPIDRAPSEPMPAQDVPSNCSFGDVNFAVDASLTKNNGFAVSVAPLGSPTAESGGSRKIVPVEDVDANPDFEIGDATLVLGALDFVDWVIPITNVGDSLYCLLVPDIEPVGSSDLNTGGYVTGSLDETGQPWCLGPGEQGYFSNLAVLDGSFDGIEGLQLSWGGGLRPNNGTLELARASVVGHTRGSCDGEEVLAFRVVNTGDARIQFDSPVGGGVAYFLDDDGVALGFEFVDVATRAGRSLRPDFGTWFTVSANHQGATTVHLYLQYEVSN